MLRPAVSPGQPDLGAHAAGLWMPLLAGAPFPGEANPLDIADGSHRADSAPSLPLGFATTAFGRSEEATGRSAERERQNRSPWEGGGSGFKKDKLENGGGAEATGSGGAEGRIQKALRVPSACDRRSDVEMAAPGGQYPSEEEASDRGRFETGTFCVQVRRGGRGRLPGGR